jgi:hypothetical protein
MLIHSFYTLPVFSGYNSINGEHPCGSDYTQNQILKGELNLSASLSQLALPFHRLTISSLSFSMQPRERCLRLESNLGHRR